MSLYTKPVLFKIGNTSHDNKGNWSYLAFRSANHVRLFCFFSG